MSKRVLVLVLLAVLGAVSAFVLRPRAAQAEEGACSVPKSAGTYRGGGDKVLVFEDKTGTLTLYNASCLPVRTITRK